VRRGFLGLRARSSEERNSDKVLLASYPEQENSDEELRASSS
jgi:hypothetical protein